VIEEGKCNEEIEYKVYERNAKKRKKVRNIVSRTHNSRWKMKIKKWPIKITRY
jgi:hypothetical protein